MCQNQVYYTREVDTTPEVLEPFVSVEPQIKGMDSMRKMSLKEAASEQASDARQQKRYGAFLTPLVNSLSSIYR
jgi:hypothetical protein